MAWPCLKGTHREEEGYTVNDEIDTDGGEETDADSLKGNACVKLVGV